MPVLGAGVVATDDDQVTRLLLLLDERGHGPADVGAMGHALDHDLDGAWRHAQGVVQGEMPLQERLDGILARQWPDAAKRRAADFVIPTGRSKRDARRAVGRVLARLKRSRSHDA